jgi:cysteine desulfurase
MARVYLDHAGTTPVHPKVIEAMQPFWREKFGNPASLHSFGQEAAQAVLAARESVAKLLDAAAPEEITFTSGGTESDNTAIIGAFYSKQKKGTHIITSVIEHHAVLHTCQFLERRGLAQVTYLPVDSTGLVDPEDVKKALRDDTILVSIMHANNEIGTIEPIAEIGAICRERKITFHTDAVQTVGHIPISVQKMNIDLLSLSGHKFYGPKGVGALYVRKGVPITPLLHGGGQESGKRSGTLNTTGIVGLGEAARQALIEMESEVKRQMEMRETLLQGLTDAIPDCMVTGHRTQRLPNNASICVRYVEGESMLLNMDLQGIAASSGSACTSGSLEASHVLLAIGIEHEIAHGSLRFTFGRDNEPSDVARVLEVLPPIIERLRAMSPLAQGK